MSNQRRSRAPAAALALATVAYAVSQTMLIPTLPTIADEFDAGPADITLLMSVFFIAGAVSVAPLGRLADVWGRRRLLVAVLTVFGAGALACAVAPTFPLLVAGRVIMGTGLAVVPLCFALVRDVVPRDGLERGLALVAGTTGAGGAIGLSAGGMITDSLGYRALFWLVLGVTGVSVLVSIASIPADGPRRREQLDIIGAGLLASALAAILAALVVVPSRGLVDPLTAGLLVGGAIVFALFFVRESTHPTPLVDLGLLGQRQLAVTNIVTFLVGIGFFALPTVATQYYQAPISTGYGGGVSATEAGLYLVPGAMALVVLAPLIGRLNERRGPRFLVRLGTTFGCIGFATIAVLVDVHGLVVVLIVTVFAAVSLIYSALPTLVVGAVPVHRSAEATSVNQMSRVIGAGVGAQLAGALLGMSLAPDGFPTSSGYRNTFIVLGGCCAGAAILGGLLDRSGGRVRPAEEPVVP